MTPAFGFSAGDFVSAVELIRKIARALKATGGASSEYQHVIIELQALERVLLNLEALRPTERNASYVNAIRGLALASRLPLQDFLEKLQRYEASLSPFGRRLDARTFKDKAKWATIMTQEVDKIRAFVGGKVLSINLLLNLHASDSIDTLGGALQRSSDLLERQASTAIDKIGSVENQIVDAKTNLAQSQDSLHRKVDDLKSTTKNHGNMLVSIKTVAQQVAHYLNSFPAELKTLLGNILQSNQQIFSHLLQVQQTLAHTPGAGDLKIIHFVDALGRPRDLDWEIFRHWEPLEGLLKADFRDLPAEAQVHEGHFHLVDERRNSALIPSQRWSQSVFPGARIAMSVAISNLRASRGICPRPGCAKIVDVPKYGLAPAVCSACDLTFYESSSGLERLLCQSSLDSEEEQVTKRQREEDLQAFGARVRPADKDEVEEAFNLIEEIEMPHKRTLDSRDGPGSSDRTVKRILLEQPASGLPKRDQSHQANSVSQVDWHGGSNPLDAWLNQSAVPSIGLPTTDESDTTKQEFLGEQQNIEKEREALQVLRRVHIANEHDNVSLDPKRESSGASRASLTDQDLAHGVGVDVYMRNIQDRYPLIPLYLARRLAEVNYQRALRLFESRKQAQHNQISCSGPLRSDEDLYEMMTIEGSTKENLEKSVYNEAPEANFSTAHPPRTKPTLPPTNVMIPRRMSLSSIQSSGEQVEFWSGKRSQGSPASEASWSSANRGLRMNYPQSPEIRTHSPHMQSSPPPSLRQSPMVLSNPPFVVPDISYACEPPGLSINTTRPTYQEQFKCRHPGCTAPPFQTQYLLNSHANVHSSARPHYCPVKGCPRGPGGKGFKRKNEMIRHGLIHNSPGYICPFFPDKDHKYPRPDNLMRHVRVHHHDRSKDDPKLLEVLRAPIEIKRGRRRRGSSSNVTTHFSLKNHTGDKGFAVLESHAVPPQSQPEISTRNFQSWGSTSVGLEREILKKPMQLEHSSFLAESSNPPAKRQPKWSQEEDALIIRLRGDGMKWEDISRHLPGRSAISCRLHYQNYLEPYPNSKKGWIAGESFGSNSSANPITLPLDLVRRRDEESRHLATIGNGSQCNYEAMHEVSKADVAQPMHERLSTDVDPVEAAAFPPDASRAEERQPKCSLDQAKRRRMRRKLPPPPIDLDGSLKSCTCGLCGRIIHIRHKISWQRHVIRDLRPYVCIFDACELGSLSWTWKELWNKHLRHHGSTHESFLSDRRCPFCYESQLNDSDLVDHTAQHLEEVSFTAITVLYDEWDFYTDLTRSTGHGSE